MTPAARRRARIDRITAWSPLLLLGGLALLTYWLDAQIQPSPPKPDGSSRHDPDIFIEHFRAVVLDANGRALQTIAAARAVHFGDDQSTEFVDPSLTLAEAGKPRLAVSAEHGVLTGNRQRATFTGNVRAVRDADPAAKPREAPVGPIRLETERLVVYLSEHRLSTDKPVTIEEPRGIIRANGLELDTDGKTLRLEAGIRGTLEPQPQRAK